MSDLLSASVRNGALEHATACHGMLCIAIKGTERLFPPILSLIRNVTLSKLIGFLFSLQCVCCYGYAVCCLNVRVFFYGNDSLTAFSCQV